MTERRYLIFEIDGERHALLLENVAEIMDPSVFYPIPKAPGCFAGVMNCHGQPTPVLDLASLYYGKSVGGAGKVLVLDRKMANLALLVHTVVNIVFGPNDGEDWKMLQVAEGSARIIEPKELFETLEAEMNGPMKGQDGNLPGQAAVSN